MDFTTGVRRRWDVAFAGPTVSAEWHGGVQFGLDRWRSLARRAGFAYALDGIPLSLIQQVEVIQGPASARFGSQAVGGVINVVLSPLHRGDAYASAHGRPWKGASVGQHGIGKGGCAVAIGVGRPSLQRRIDDNLTASRMRLPWSGRWPRFGINQVGVTTVALHDTGVGRRAIWRRPLVPRTDRGTENVYGERIDLLRAEAAGRRATRRPRLDLAGRRDRPSPGVDGGTTQFNAQEWTANLDAYHSGWSWSEGQHLRGA